MRSDVTESLVLTDPTDALGRRCLRVVLNADGDLALLDLPKRVVGSTPPRYTEVSVSRALDRDGARYLLAWLEEHLDRLRGEE